MNEIELKHSIESSIRAFLSGSISQNALNLFVKLGYKTDRQNPFIEKTYRFFKESFLEPDTSFNEVKARVDDWKSIDLLFQLTQEELSDQKTLFDTKRVDNTIIETYLFFAIELIKTDYSRSALAQITREINKIFPMPVMLLFKYDEHLTLSIINRRLNKKDAQRDVLEKVTLIKDINFKNPHRAHIEILYDLSLGELKKVYKYANFVELHNAWQKTLDTKELNKRFYRELSNWYFWAINCVSFPNDIDDDKDDTVFNSESIIRLLTRLIFIWFIKEKSLVPEIIFDGKEVSKMIKGFKTKDSKVYYRSILQNLFFATLNQKIEERAFATDGTFEQNKKNYGIKNLYRYSSDFTISKDEVIKLFKDVPFLNGGLFDCLDSENKNGKVIYLDGFSRNPKKQAQVPDELFFSKEKIVDLSTVYDNKKKKNETVRGLFEIFNHYKFTITENTPIEEEVALDPELLGRVFENLLASYNPETKTTARKQTGSFYTPREIVNYMVDESLKAYLKQKLETEAGMKPEDAEVGLEFLLGYNEKENLFNEKETPILIKAIDNCKILDPACGSGAFPMGILHKLVHILHKLDPQNKLWEEQQIKKVDNLIKEAGNINDSAIRDKIIADLETNKKDIEESFNNNELDYGRKLYLVENGIYGVDIQPIATQISKLRFFISLIVDQKVNKTKVNFGIRPLPNLETKFVAANTLIGIEKPKAGDFVGSIFDSNEVKELEEKLKDIRHHLFSAKTPATKRKMREEDQRLREEIALLLIQNGWGNESARHLAAWDPYNQNASSSFFDPEWMFGITDGFDVVIGNPPYINTKRGIEKFEKEYFKRKYKSAKGQFDIFCIFVEMALLNGKIVSYIVPKPIINNENYLICRKLMLDTGLCNVVTGSNIFEASGVESCIFLCDKNNMNEIDINKYEKGNFLYKWKTNKDVSKELPFEMINTELDEKNLSLIKAIQKDSNTVGNILSITRGIEAGKSDNCITKNETKYKLLRGEDVTNYKCHFRNFYTNYDKKDIIKFKKLSLYIGEKILIRRVGNELVATFDNQNYLTLNTIYNCKSLNEKVSLFYILGIINSSIIKNWFKKVFILTDKLFPYVRVSQLKYIPIKFNKVFEKPIEQLANYILYLKKQNKNSIFFELLVDAIVCELYFPQEIKSANAEILRYLTNLPELKDELSDDKKIEVIEKVYKEISDPKHPVSIAMEKQKMVPEVRIIEGLPALNEIKGDK